MEEITKRRNLGGRGQKSDYPTTSVRVPIVIKELVQKVVSGFYDVYLSDQSDDLLDTYQLDNKLAQISALVEKYKLENKPTKRVTKLSEFMNEIEAILIDPDQL